MKKFCVIFFSFSFILFGQINTFEKVHYDFDRGYSIEECSDHSFISTATKNDTVHVVKLDADGDIIWSTKINDAIIDYYSAKRCVVKPLYDSTFLLFTDYLSTTADVKATRLNSSGQIISEDVFDFNQGDYFKDFVVTQDGDIILLTISSDADSNTYLTRLNLLGEIIWQRSYSGRGGDVLRFSEDNNLLMVNGGFIRKISLDGNFLWYRVQIKSWETIIPYGSKIYAIDNYYLAQLNSFSIHEWSTFTTVGNTDIGVLQYGNIALLKEDELRLYSPDAVLIKQKNIYGRGNCLRKLNLSGLIVTGRYNDGFWLLKTNNDFDYKSVLLLKPTKDEYVTVGGTFELPLVARNIQGNLTLKLSTDSGNSWLIINNDIDPLQDTISWNPPAIISENCLLHIVSNSDPNIFYTSPIFRITPGAVYDYLAVNQIKMWVSNYGDGSHRYYEDEAGFLWPGGADAVLPAVYADGLVFSGMIDGELKANGNMHRTGLQPGIILSTGIADDKNKSKYCVWKLKRNWENLPPGPDRERYEWIYNNWPFEIGAPYIDNDGNGIYTPGIDEPDYIGDEVLYYVVNDLDPELTRLGSTPIGLEFQVSTFGFDRQDVIKNVVYKRYLIINKSDETIEDMYLSYWADPDLGDANDDCVGVDSILNLGYCYNFDEDDMVYGSPPPSVGHRIVQGPIVQGTQQDSGLFKGKWIHGIRNLNTSAIVLNTNMSPYRDPGTVVEMHNYQTGLNFNGEQFINPHTQVATKFPLGGDPVTGIGWYWGTGWPGGVQPTDIRYLVTCGPFNMSTTDTQEVVVAIVIDSGTDRLNSIEKMKNVSIAADNFYKSQFTFTSVGDNPPVYSYKLEQNYPNPFNPGTNIQFQLAKPGMVELKLYNILGEEVKTIMNEFRTAGEHKITVNLNSFAAGVYFYRLRSGDYSSVKKMILLK